MMDQTLEIYQNLAQMERKLERAGTPGIWCAATCIQNGHEYASTYYRK